MVKAIFFKHDVSVYKSGEIVTETLITRRHKITQAETKEIEKRTGGRVVEDATKQVTYVMPDELFLANANFSE